MVSERVLPTHYAACHTRTLTHQLGLVYRYWMAAFHHENGVCSAMHDRSFITAVQVRRDVRG